VRGDVGCVVSMGKWRSASMAELRGLVPKLDALSVECSICSEAVGVGCL
jgi:hypothetical protein